jgi:RNA-directed DNA polymerase
MMNGREKSDLSKVAKRSTNKSGDPEAESEERRGRAEGNAVGDYACRTPSRGSALSGLDRVRERARKEKSERFTALLHHVNPDLLRAAFFWLKREAAPGIDGLTWKEYERNLEERLCDLHARVHRGAYRAAGSAHVAYLETGGAVTGRQDSVRQGSGTHVLSLRGCRIHYRGGQDNGSTYLEAIGADRPIR